mmetsp:Transcript_5810/g.8402  ORF Transcript_5810/g.8402 Transcript_5810/m.8402 type:complete len:409 (+) Transcript_5810:126-1352(+)
MIDRFLFKARRSIGIYLSSSGRKIHRRELHSTTSSRSGDHVSIEVWQNACSKLHISQICPSPEQKLNALFGDKILGGVSALIIQEKISNTIQDTTKNGENKPDPDFAIPASIDRGYASTLIGYALSNQFFEHNADTLLPAGWIQNNEHLGVRSVGTMLEAAVAAVYGSNPDAVKALAHWLLHTASHKIHNFNPKGQLLEMKGKVDTMVEHGSDPNNPIYIATASLQEEEQKATGTGSSKREAESSAARSLLLELGLLVEAKLETPATILPPEVSQRKEDWIKFNGGPTFHTLTVFNQSAHQWWEEKAVSSGSAYRGALLAPLVFGSVVVAVDSWSRSHEDGDAKTASRAVLILITYYGEEGELKYQCFVESGQSFNSARKVAGKRACEFIRKITAFGAASECDGDNNI